MGSTKYLKRSLPYIRALLSTRSGVERDRIFKTFPNYVALDIVEVLYNILHKNCPISCIHKRQLLKQRNNISSLIQSVLHKETRKNKANEAARLLYKQKGRGIFSIILPIVASAIGGLLTSSKNGK